MADSDPLTIAAADLKRAAPELWGRFTTAFETYHQARLTDVIKSPVDRLQASQGHVQATLRLLELLRDCVATADKLKGKKL